MGCSGHDFFPSTPSHCNGHLSGHQLVPQVLSRDRNCSKDPAGNGTVIVHLAGSGGCSGQLRFISHSLSPSLFPVPSALPTVDFTYRSQRVQLNLEGQFQHDFADGNCEFRLFAVKNRDQLLMLFFQFGTLALQNPHQNYLACPHGLSKKTQLQASM